MPDVHLLANWRQAQRNEAWAGTEGKPSQVRRYPISRLEAQRLTGFGIVGLAPCRPQWAQFGHCRPTQLQLPLISFDAIGHVRGVGEKRLVKPRICSGSSYPQVVVVTTPVTTTDPRGHI